ncbi:uncharacterized protein UV8b_07406 [Ustilaginoidea virens]|uniref:Uncharacterized protein n=1 Tax=Ustilaginoidea virens TaxID=1159556 RepID=A0A063BX53_USTVR|nr:uncharacterized protein UV8b_07406 [Ustilaginoidea virens]QUC23165.1 hypothetical protein UV8b_07406 [Ustilaginoidea virens]GAO17739.1 hypothetical protein UVI_02033410 [Ustilaginoidea virens]
MTLSRGKLEEALIQGTYQVFTSDPDATTVNKVRKHVEDAQNLQAGFFASDEWKQRSKILIKEYVDKFLDGWVPGETEANDGTKRQAPEDISPSPKRRKQGAKTGSDSMKGKTTGNPSPVKAAASPSPIKQAKVKEKPGAVEKKPSPTKEVEGSGDEALSSIKVDTSKPLVSEEEEFSDVIDEPPKAARKKKDAKQKSSKPAKPAAKSKQKAMTSISDDAKEVEIKKLQSQLVKCGIRKLWHNELKQYGDDARAKIRHLKKILADIGMDGRFSEAKAREIKEMRELIADAESAQEMNRLWGVDSGARASRSKQKSTKSDESNGSEVEAETDDASKANDDHDDQDSDDGNTSFAARRRRAQADLAFLGDDSESE